MKKPYRIAVLFGVLSVGCMTATAQSSSDKDFLEKSSQGNVAEVELGKLALKKSNNAEVKTFAKHMIADHQKLARSMKPFINKAGVQSSTSLNTEHQHLYDKLNGLSGTEFDKEYVTAMDKDHHEDLDDFKKEGDSTQDPALKKAVQAGSAVIAQHTKMIDALSGKMGSKTAGK